MTSDKNTSKSNEAFSLSSLMARYVEKQAKAHQDGLAAIVPDGEVLPYDSGPVQVIEPKIAWNDALIAADLDSAEHRPCPEWSALVAAQEPAFAVAFCCGNYPQMVRSFVPMLQGDFVTPAPTKLPETFDTTVYLQWAEQSAQKEGSSALVAAAVLRLAAEHEAANNHLEQAKSSLEGPWQAAWLNERAAIQWHAGQHEEALKQWQSQEPSTTVLFNRGMALLFTGEAAQAHTALTEAVARIPENNSWHHLAQLYLTLAAMRSSQ